jgi:hypothetical protein
LAEVGQAVVGVRRFTHLGHWQLAGSKESRPMELDTLQFVVRADGRPTAVQIDIESWRKIVETLENAEDVSLARKALAELEAAGGDPDKAGWLRLEDSVGWD